MNEPCGPSTQTGWPGLSRLMPRVKSPALRIVNSTRPGRCGDEAIVNGCSSAVTDRVSRSQANWPGAKSQLSSASPLRAARLTVVTVGDSRRTCATTNSVDGSRSVRHSQRCARTPVTATASRTKIVYRAGSLIRWLSHSTCSAEPASVVIASSTWIQRHTS